MFGHRVEVPFAAGEQLAHEVVLDIIEGVIDHGDLHALFMINTFN